MRRIHDKTQPDRAAPRCHVDRAFEEVVTLSMSVEAYKRDHKVRWDPAKETIVS
jgi:hypothetical protein